MVESANLELPYIMPSQAQKHITHNEAIARLDAVVQLGVIDRDLASPPGTPTDGDRYIVGEAAAGAWSGWEGSVAVRHAGAWLRLVPHPGWLCWIADEETLVYWTGSAWASIGSANIGALGTAGGTLTGPLGLSHQASPDNPPAGVVVLFAKDDDKLYTRAPDGTETEIGAGVGGGGGPVEAADVGFDPTGAIAAGNVQDALEELDAEKAPLASPALTGTPTAPTASGGTNTTQLATTAFVQGEIAALIEGAPGALNTLDELAAALGDDANFASTVTTALAGKQPLDSDLTAIAALTTTSFGRGLLTLPDEAAFKAAVNLENAADIPSSATGGVAATNVQAAIAELDAEKVAKTGGALTGGLTVTGAGFHFVSDVEGSGNPMQATKWIDGAGGPVVVGRKARGTISSPAAPQANDTILGFRAYGWNGTGSDGFISATYGAAFLLEASENWDSVKTGAQVRFFVTPNGNGVLTPSVEHTRFAADGSLQMGGANTVISAARHPQLRAYTVSTLPSAANAGELIYVSNGASSKRLAVSDGSNWRWPDGAVVS